MTSVKAVLTVVLKANDVVVAEAEDSVLWQRVLTAIQGQNKGELLGGVAAGPLLPAESAGVAQTPASFATSNDPIEKLARELGLERSMIDGALSPTIEAPFLRLNSHNWEAMRRQLPARGSSALSPIAAAATLLALWFRAAGLGNPTQSQALATLREIGEDDKNPSRGVRAATWLIARPGGQVQLNASEISTAIKLGKAFCAKQWKDWLTGKTAE